MDKNHSVFTFISYSPTLIKLKQVAYAHQATQVRFHLSLRKVGWWGLQITITKHSLWGAGVVQWQSSRVGLECCILVIRLISYYIIDL